MNDVIQQIKKKLHLAMDGMNASSMREKGLDYGENFGVPIVTLRKIARLYAPNSELAAILWKEDTRELKILATLIQESQEFSEADQWVGSITNLELAEQACMNLFCKMSHAGKYAGCWIGSPILYIKLSAFLLYARLFMTNYQMEEKEKETYFFSLFDALGGDSLLLKNAAVNSLKRLGQQSVVHAKDILARIESDQSLQLLEKRSFYDSLKSDFDYYT